MSELTKESKSKLHKLWSLLPSIHLSIYIEKNSIIKTVIRKDTKFSYAIFPNGHMLTPLIEEWVVSYLEKRPSRPELPLYMHKLSSFTATVLNALKKIPLGNTASYGEIAKATGSPKAFRSVGNICHNNPFPLLIPCHRVVRSHGGLGGYAYDLSIKRQLLRFEKENYPPFGTLFSRYSGKEKEEGNDERREITQKDCKARIDLRSTTV